MSSDLKAVIRESTNSLRQEIVAFIENMVQVHERQVSSSPVSLVPRLPIFYIKGYNVLKRACKSLGPDYKDPILEFLPQAILMSSLTEFDGAIKEMPRVSEQGYLYESREESLKAQVARFFDDVAVLVSDWISVNEELPPPPTCVDLMRTYWKSKPFPGESKQFLETFEQDLTAYLIKAIGEEYIPHDYIQKN